MQLPGRGLGEQGDLGSVEVIDLFDELIRVGLADVEILRDLAFLDPELGHLPPLGVDVLPPFGAGLLLHEVEARFVNVKGIFERRSKAGLGNLILESNVQFNVAQMFAILLILGVFGVGLSLLVRLVQQRLLFWNAGFGSQAI
jgi:hypothetical protein